VGEAKERYLVYEPMDGSRRDGERCTHSTTIDDDKGERQNSEGFPPESRLTCPSTSTKNLSRDTLNDRVTNISRFTIKAFLLSFRASNASSLAANEVGRSRSEDHLTFWPHLSPPHTSLIAFLPLFATTVVNKLIK
jgi:hypothetical protein